MNIRQASLFFPLTSLLLATGFVVKPVLADHLNFTFYNESSKPIYALYVSAAHFRDWGSDILGTDTLGMGESTRITFPGQDNDSPCIYDIKAVFTDNSVSTGRYNLCAADYVTVR